jgi:hypothetical protein
MKYVRRILTALLAAWVGTAAYGDTISTSSGGNWSTATIWTPPTVPNNSAGVGYDVTIGSSGFVALDVSPTINSLTLDGTLYAPRSIAPQLTIVNGANVNGPLLFGGEYSQPPVGPGSLSVGGDLNIGASSAPFVVNGPLTVGGSLTNSSPGMVLVSNTASDRFSVAGALTNQAGGTMFLGNSRCFNPNAGCPSATPFTALLPGPTTSVGAFVNSGKIYSWSNITASILTNNGMASFINGSAGAATLRNGGTVYIANSCCSLAPEQTSALSVGTGTPTSLGYTQFTNGVLDEILSGNSAYGQINAGPWSTPPRGQLRGYPVDLSGTLDILLRNGFIPSIGEAFTIITTGPGDISGSFNHVVWDSFDNGQGYFSISYDNAAGDVVITAEAIPEPRTFFLLVPLLSFVFWRTRGSRASDA